MAIDYWKLVRDFSPGDPVMRFVPGLGGMSLSPFTGRVTAVHRGLGVVDVQWPYGNERMFPDDIVRVDHRINTYLPPSLDTTYVSWDLTKQAHAHTGGWRDKALPAGFYQDLARLFSKAANEVAAYDQLWHKYTTYGADDEAIRSEVAKFYLVAQNLAALRIQQHTAKTAVYWAAQNRQHRATKGEIEARIPKCPKCATGMRRTTYKMDGGSRVRLFACPKDLFLIRQDDILSPDGSPVTW